MTTSRVDIEIPNASAVITTDESLTVELDDGRTISVPLTWFPRLLQASIQERNNWEIIGKGQGIHWEELDEDISVEGLIAGRHSNESQVSFKRWLQARMKKT
jgi:hypothetical protein